MTTKIELRFEGDAPGLAEGRLSLGAFLPALGELLTALRRIGSNIIVDATGDPDHGGKGGRIHKQAEVLDLEIGEVSHNCLLIDTTTTARPKIGESRSLFDDLPERAGDELLASIEAESAGRQRNHRVRQYLDALPRGISEQRYRLLVNGAEKRVVTVGLVKPAEVSAVLPGLRDFVARASGVIFDGTQPQIRLTDSDGGHKWHRASAAHVQTVLSNRDQALRVLVLYGAEQSSRILRLAVGDQQLPVPGPEAKRRRLFVDWDGVLRRLA